MDIPGIGNVSHKKLQDTELCLEILMGCKHQLLEGLIVENLVDQWISSLPAESTIHEIPQTTLILQRKVKGNLKPPCAAVLLDPSQKTVSRYLDALATYFPVIPCRYDASCCEFFTSDKWQNTGKIPLMDKALTGKMSEWTKCAPFHHPVEENVRDRQRQKRSFWGFLEGHYGNELLERVVLPRIFKDFGPQLWFDFGWDVDRLLLKDDHLWSLEIKHKYPFGKNELCFGINFGELNSIEWLENCDIPSLHLIVVKPVWNKNESPHYIFNDIQKRSKALVLGLLLDRNTISKIRSRSSGQSASYTTFSGKGRLSYYSIPASWFGKMGVVSDPPEKIAGNIIKMLEGENIPLITDKELYSYKI